MDRKNEARSAGRNANALVEPIREFGGRADRLDPLLPQSGKVNEMCREWLVREDGALAYRLQSQEITQHYSGNKNRNAQVREDFPCALDEQLREQQLADQAAAVYHKMLQEQEDLDQQIAKDLADKIEREEHLRRRAIEMQDEDLARHLLDKERSRNKQSALPPIPSHHSPHKPSSLPIRESYPSPHRPDSLNYQANLPRRQAPAMPLPEDYHDLYTEPYKAEQLTDDFDRIDIQEVGLPLDDRRIQEEKDAELARQLQEQLSNSEESILNRDRMLAMEAQDKELAKLLQERERAKAKRAKERARQKALAKKQQQLEQQEHNMHQIMPDDSYSNPVDLLPQRSVLHNIRNVVAVNNDVQACEDDTNYSFPVDVLPNSRAHKHQNGGSTQLAQYVNLDDGDVPPPVRPTHLELRSPISQKLLKPKYPDPVEPDPSPDNQMPSPSKQLTNIAMAIDPTYPRRNMHSPPSYDLSSSTVTTSTSSSSPSLMLPTPDISEDDPSPVPPYMPIQGQRRTASLEKKTKRKAKDGCKQQ